MIPSRFLIIAIVIAGSLVVVFWQYRYQGRQPHKPVVEVQLSPGLADPHLLTPPVPFGYKTAWFAIRSEDLNAVVAALEVQRPQNVNWRYGIHHADTYNEYQIFITPPVNGWILATGVPIVFDADSHAKDRIVALSKQFGEAQFFASVRTSNSYIWASASKGKLVRLFSEEDGQRRTLGLESEAETRLGFKFFDASSPESSQPGYWQRKDLTYPDEDSVLKIAGIWSVDPSKLEQIGLKQSLGILGGPSASYPPKPAPIR